MAHKCTYYDEGYCLNVYGETCPYNGTDEQCKCLEYEPKENYIAAFTNEIIESYKEQIKDLQNKLAEVLSQVNVSKEMTLQEARRQTAKEIIEKLRKKASDNFQYYNMSVVNLGDLTDVLEEYEDDDEVISLLPDIRGEI